VLKPIRSTRISEKVYEQIRDMIYRGQLKAGERLMPERELAEVLRVGRPTVREAIQKLIDQGIVESRRGVGTFVLGEESRRENKPLLQVLNGQDFSILEFLEVRMALECNSAALAAKRATEEDLRLLEESVSRLRGERERSERLLENELSFHMNVAYATKNTVQVHLMKSFYDVLYYGMNRAFPTLIQDRDLDELAFEHHLRIYEAIKNRDTNLARETMERHILSVMEICRQKGL
jgi:GntR family transcriptional repressor for pyruvate dehydrogenase complex